MTSEKRIVRKTPLGKILFATLNKPIPKFSKTGSIAKRVAEERQKGATDEQLTRELGIAEYVARIEIDTTTAEGKGFKKYVSQLNEKRAEALKGQTGDTMTLTLRSSYPIATFKHGVKATGEDRPARFDSRYDTATGRLSFKVSGDETSGEAGMYLTGIDFESIEIDNSAAEVVDVEVVDSYESLA